MSHHTLEQFRSEVLGHQLMPEDLRWLTVSQLAHQNAATLTDNPVWALGCKVIMPGDIVALRDMTYLGDADRANPDIMANVRATADVLALCTLVIEFEDGEILGYWHGPQRTPIREAPLIMLDTEGQIGLVAGRKVAEQVLFWLTFDDQARLKERRAALAAIGIHIAAATAAALPLPSAGADEPAKLQQERYATYRAAGPLP